MFIKQIDNYEVQIQKPSAYEIIRHAGIFFKLMENPQSLEVKDVDEFVIALLGHSKAIELSTQKEFRLVSPQVLTRVFGDDLKTLLEFLAESLQELFQLSSQFLNTSSVQQEDQTINENHS